MMQDRFPQPFEAVFNGVEMRGNPWNEHPTSRMQWAKGLDVRTMAEVQAKLAAFDVSEPTSR